MSEYDDPNAPPDLLGRDIAAVPPQPSRNDPLPEGFEEFLRRQSQGEQFPDVAAYGREHPKEAIAKTLESLGEVTPVPAGIRTIKDLNQGEYGEAAKEAAPWLGAGAGKVIGTVARMPRAVGIPALAGSALLAGTANAGEPTDPLDLLRAHQADIQKKMDDAAATMQQFAPKPRKAGQPPPDQMSDPKYFNAKATYDRLNTQYGDIKGQIDNELTARQQHEEGIKTGSQRLKDIEANVGPWEKGFQEWGPNLSYLLGGVLGGVKGFFTGRKFTAAAQDAADRANALLPVKGLPKGDLPKRVQNANQFYTEGKGTAPFPTAAGETPPFTLNPNPTPAEQLYPKTYRRESLASAPWLAGYTADAGLGGYMAYRAGQDRAQAEADMRDGKMDEGTIQRWEKAKHDEAFWESLGNAGRGAIVGHLGMASMPALVGNRARPNVSEAAAERDRLDKLITKQRGPGGGPTPLPPPIPLNPTGGGGQGGNAIGPGVPLIRGVLPPPAAGPAQGNQPQAAKGQTAVPGGGGSSAKRGASATKSKAPPDDKYQGERDFKPIGPEDEAYWEGKLTKGQNRGGRIHKATGGGVHVGPLTQDNAGGRTDTIPVDVESGAYVVPADIVSWLGQGDTAAGYKVLGHMFGADAGPGKPTPILAAGGEYVISPSAAQKVGRGDLAAGHDALDHWVKVERRKQIMKLSSLPPPKQD